MLVTAISIAALMPCNTADSTHLSTSLILTAIMHDLLSHMYTCHLALLLLSFTSQLCHVCIRSFSPLFTSSLCSSFASAAVVPCVHYQWRRRTRPVTWRNMWILSIYCISTYFSMLWWYSRALMSSSFVKETNRGHWPLRTYFSNQNVHHFNILHVHLVPRRAKYAWRWTKVTFWLVIAW